MIGIEIGTMKGGDENRSFGRSARKTIVDFIRLFVIEV